MFVTIRIHIYENLKDSRTEFVVIELITLLSGIPLNSRAAKSD